MQCGTMSLSVTVKSTEHILDFLLYFIIVFHCLTTILELPSCCQLYVVQTVNAHKGTSNFLAEFVDVFSNVGSYSG